MILNLPGDGIITSVTTQRRAIVIGGGIAGILASRVLSDHFDQVILLERDKYPNHPELRAGIPHAKHVHILLLRGRQILEELFPGLSKQLIDNGAGTIKMGKELAILSYYGWRIKHPEGFKLLTFTHPLLEWCLRRRLANITTISSLEGCRVIGLVPDQEARSVVGVHCRFSKHRDREQRLYGDLVVDASGRFSRTPEWLSAIGYSRPKETVVDPFLGYASRLYAMPDNFVTIPGASQPQWRALLIQGKPPDHTRGGVLLPVEGNRWHVTLAGISKDYPPTDDAGYLEFARTLRSSILFDAIKDAQALTSISGAQSTNNRLCHYEALPRWPRRFVVIGDAVSVFNPSFAQGISVAALQAMFLARCLRERDHKGMAQHFQQKLAGVIKTPWLMATTDDLRWPGTEGGHLGLQKRFMHWYLDAVFALATKHSHIDHIFVQVAHLVKPVRTLFHPRIILHVLARKFSALSPKR